MSKKEVLDRPEQEQTSLQTKTEAAGIARRDFLKGAALTGVGAAAAAALAACSPTTTGSTGGDAGGSSAGGEGGTGSSGGTGSTGGSELAKASGLVGGVITAEDWLGEPPVIAEADIEEELDFDVVVLGGGHAGTNAACGAAQEGVRVAVVERQLKEEYACFGDDICSYNSKFVTEKGFGPYNVAEIVQEYVKRGNGRVNPGIIRKFVENSGEMMDNMVAVTPSTSNIFDYEGGQCIIQHAYGKEQASDYPFIISGYKSWATTVQTIGSTNPTPVDGREGLSRLTEIETYVRLAAEELGAQWFWGHEATVLVQNDEGDVIGAIAQKPNGKYVKLNAAKGVLLACGDFSGNADMVWNLLDEVAEWGAKIGEDRADMAGSGRDGVGHKLGCWAGGAMEPHPRPTMDGGTVGAWGSTPFLYLNANGQRFTNEAIAQLNGAMVRQQPAGLVAAITDAKYMDSIKAVGIDHGAPNWGAPDFVMTLVPAMEAIPVGPDGGGIPNIEIINVKSMESGQTSGTVYKAETLSDLLDYLGYEGEAKQTALASIERYNQLCASGVDDDFFKDSQFMLSIDTAPFYASKSEARWKTRAGLVCLAGLFCDENLNVLKADRSGPIKGLYAAGNCLGMRYGNGYATPSAGNSMGMAMTHGRWAGKHIANL